MNLYHQLLEMHLPIRLIGSIPSCVIVIQSNLNVNLQKQSPDPQLYRLRTDAAILIALNELQPRCFSYFSASRNQADLLQAMVWTKADVPTVWEPMPLFLLLWMSCNLDASPIFSASRNQADLLQAMVWTKADVLFSASRNQADLLQAMVWTKADVLTVCFPRMLRFRLRSTRMQNAGWRIKRSLLWKAGWFSRVTH